MTAASLAEIQACGRPDMSSCRTSMTPARNACRCHAQGWRRRLDVRARRVLYRRVRRERALARVEAAAACHQPRQAEQGADVRGRDADPSADLVHGGDERIELDRAA